MNPPSEEQGEFLRWQFLQPQQVKHTEGRINTTLLVWHTQHYAQTYNVNRKFTARPENNQKLKLNRDRDSSTLHPIRHSCMIPVCQPCESA